MTYTMYVRNGRDWTPLDDIRFRDPDYADLAGAVLVKAGVVSAVQILPDM